MKKLLLATLPVLFGVGLFGAEYSYVDEVDVLSSTAMIESAIKRVPKQECREVLVVRPCGRGDERRGYFKSSNYDQSDVGAYSEIHRGEIMDERHVNLEDDGVGTVMGAIIGAGIGNTIGESWSTRDQQITAGIGAIIGGMTGNSVNSGSGQELAIRLKDGRELVMVNAIDKSNPFSFRRGDLVKLHMRGGKVMTIELDNRGHDSGKEECESLEERCETTYEEQKETIITGYKNVLSYKNRSFEMITQEKIETKKIKARVSLEFLR